MVVWGDWKCTVSAVELYAVKCCKEKKLFTFGCSSYAGRFQKNAVNVILYGRCELSSTNSETLALWHFLARVVHTSPGTVPPLWLWQATCCVLAAPLHHLFTTPPPASSSELQEFPLSLPLERASKHQPRVQMLFEFISNTLAGLDWARMVQWMSLKSVNLAHLAHQDRRKQTLLNNLNKYLKPGLANTELDGEQNWCVVHYWCRSWWGLFYTGWGLFNIVSIHLLNFDSALPEFDN